MYSYQVPGKSQFHYNGPQRQSNVVTAPRHHQVHHSKESSKSHIMLCEKHVTTGLCPYEGKCKYIHDRDVAVPRGVCKPCKHEKDRNKGEDAKDSFYWPNSPALSHNPYEYDVLPVCEPKFFLRHRAVYSMWKHFKWFCLINKSSVVTKVLPVNDPNVSTNTFTSTKRLDVFVTLSQGRSLEAPKSVVETVPEVAESNSNKVLSPVSVVMFNDDADSSNVPQPVDITPADELKMGILRDKSALECSMKANLMLMSKSKPLVSKYHEALSSPRQMITKYLLY